MTKILLLGSRGRLGATLAEAWAGRHQVKALSRADMDLSDLVALERLLQSESYDLLVNASGTTSLEGCEAAPELARIMNAAVPAVMASAAAKAGAVCLHFSTDYVFDGTHKGLYTEEDEPHPLSVYGQTKLEGERAVLSASPRHLCFRVSWIFGPKKPSFIDTMLARAMSEESVEAVDDKTSCPTSATDIAKWLEPFLDGSLPGGLYHACNEGACSWKAFAQEGIDVAAGLGWPLKTKHVRGIPMASVQTFRAVRPRHTAMDCRKLARATGLTPRPWQDALAAYLASGM